MTINGEVIKTTFEHPFYVKDVGFVEAGKLQVGDKLVDSRGNVLVLEGKKLEITDKPVKVYNFKVDNFHTYHVGNDGILVHNADYNLGNKRRIPHRTEPRIEDGNLHEGWIHIESRHITGNHPNGPGDLFAPGTTRKQIEEAAKILVKKGTRISDPSRRIQTFEKVIKVNGKRDLVRVIVDSDDFNRVITIFPVRGGH